MKNPLDDLSPSIPLSMKWREEIGGEV